MSQGTRLHYFAGARRTERQAFPCVSQGEARFWAGLTFAASRLYQVEAYTWDPVHQEFEFHHHLT